MKMTKHRWIGLMLGVTIFLAAFGVALAVTVFQTSKEVPSVLTLGSAVVISSDNLALWHDRERKEPVTFLDFKSVQLKPPLEGSLRPEVWIYIENKSDRDLTLIQPCREVVTKEGVRIGSMDAGLQDLDGKDRRGTCEAQEGGGGGR